ncbi:MAG: hypothetical protein KC736_01345 [Candidatus Moranbacteria bacterium]|nr:hypothetical protein [Candidatus Moranbacteria bacterium]
MAIDKTILYPILRFLGLVLGVPIVLVALYFGTILFLDWKRQPVYVDTPIDEIEYAPPSEEAKNFDWEAYVDSFPQIAYEKIDYPVKETYTYHFNGYTLTVDIPEGLDAHIIPLEEEPRVIQSEGLEDSCWRFGGDAGYTCASEGYDFWRIGKGVLNSANRLCIGSVREKNSRQTCYGISIISQKSRFAGVSLRESMLIMRGRNSRHITNFQQKKIRENIARHTMFSDL